MDVIVENLTKSFGMQKAISAVSFKARQGEVLGFLGPNGAGKTTTMKIMAGFLFPDCGEVYFGKDSIRKNPARIKQSTGYLSEHNPLYEEMNVVDFLTFIAKLHRIPRYKIDSRVVDILQLCGLEHEKHKNIRELSKGYRQRTGLAQALIHDPEVSIVGGPTTGRDPNQIAEIRELIKRIGREKTVILSSHILAEIEATCDRVLIINKGKIVANGTSAELRSKSNAGKTLRVRIGSAGEEDVRQALGALPGIQKLNHPAGSPFFELQSDRETAIEQLIFDTCARNGWYIQELTPVETRLEDIFRQVTQN